MFRALFRLLILFIVLVGVGGYFLGWWGNGVAMPTRGEVAANGENAADRAKRAGAEISQKTAEVAKSAQEALSDGALTGKIKAKIALDDTVKALELNVDTTDMVVTVTGRAHTSAQRERVLALARETNGVRQVIDRIALDR